MQPQPLAAILAELRLSELTTMSDWATLVAAIAAVLSVVASLINRHQITQLHLQINSRMDEWIKLTRDSALAEGRLAGAKEEADKPK